MERTVVVTKSDGRVVARYPIVFGSLTGPDPRPEDFIQEAKRFIVEDRLALPEEIGLLRFEVHRS